MLSNLGETIYFNTLFVAVLCRYVVIFKELGSSHCQRIFDFAIQGQGLMICIIFIIWTYTILTLRLPLLVLEYESGFKDGHCNIFYKEMYIVIVESGYSVYSVTMFSVIPTSFITCVTTIIGIIVYRRRTPNANGTAHKENIQFTCQILFFVIFGLAFQLAFPRCWFLKHFDIEELPFGSILASVYHCVLTGYVSYTVWPILKQAMETVIKDITCKKCEASDTVDHMVMSTTTSTNL